MKIEHSIETAETSSARLLRLSRKLCVGLALACGLGMALAQPLPNGTYTLAPANATGTRLDVVGSGTANGTRAQIFTSNGGTNQQWIFTSTGGNVYRLSPVHASSTSLEVTGAFTTTSGTNIEIWADNGGSNQRWAITAVAGGYTLTPQSATATRLNAAGSTSGSNVNMTTANGSTAQTWAIVAVGGGSPPLANGTYSLAPGNATGLRLDVQGASTADGTNVQAATSNGGTNQQWIFTNVSGSTYRVSPVHASAECLDVAGQATASGTNVQIWTYLSQANQQWTVTAVSGGYTLTPTHATGLRLNNTGTANGSNVNVLTANSATSQTWVIAAVGGGGGSAPAAPTGLSATASGSGQVSLAWNASSGATSYSVFRGTTANGESTTAIATGVTSTNYINTGLTNGTAYYYKVKAVNASGTSGYSNEASATPIAGSTETIGGGTISSPASGPAPSFGIGGSGFVLVKNWNFGTGGTIKNRADLNQEFQYTDQFNTPAGGGNQYGSLFIGSDSTHQSVSGRYDGGPGTPNTRDFMADTLRTYLVPLDGTSSVFPGSQNVGCGSIVAKWTLPAGGSHLNQDIIWEVKVRFTPLQEFWFAIWTSGNQWNGGAEEDVVEAFGWDHGGGTTNWNGRLWHSDSVGGNNTQNPNFINDWPGGMSAAGVNPNTYDPMQFHIWTWLFKRDNTFAAYVDNVKVQSGTLIWTDGGTAGGAPINMFFELDGAWGHWGIGGDMNVSVPSTTLTGKYYDWDYSRVYLKP